MKSFYKKVTLFSLITFICGIIIFLPAKVSNDWFLPNSIEFYGTKGTLWRGSAQEGLVNKIYIKNIEWKFLFSKLFKGQFALNTSFSLLESPIKMRISKHFNGDFSISNSKANLQNGIVPIFYPELGIDGDININLSNLVFADDFISQVNGTISVNNLLILGLSSMSIGNYVITINTNNNGIYGDIKSIDGELDVDASLRIAPDRTYYITGLVASKANTNLYIKEILKFLGTPNTLGQREFRFEGSL